MQSKSFNLNINIPIKPFKKIPERPCIFERIYFINGHGGNISTLKAAFHQIYATALEKNLAVGKKLRCKLNSWFLVPEVYKLANELYGDKEGKHATPSEISLTLHLEPSLLSKHHSLPDPAPAGPITNYEDFRRRHPDGRMGSYPSLAKSEQGKLFLEKASIALSKDLEKFLSHS